MAATGQVAGGLTEYDRQVLTAVNAGAASLSFVGSGFIVLCYVLFKELRKFSFKLVFYLALSDMLCSFFSMVGDPSRGFFCYSHGYSTHFFCVASFLWTTTIAFTLHRTVVRHKTDVEDMEAMFHLYVWGTSLVMTVVRSIGNNHSHLGTWCWSQSGRTGKSSSAISWFYKLQHLEPRWSGGILDDVWENIFNVEAAVIDTTNAIHFITFYMPLWGAILYNGFTYFQVISMLKNARRMAVGMSDRAYQSDARAEMKALNRWGYYPLILIGAWAFGTINRIHDFIEPGHKIFWLSLLDVGTSALMGLFNSIAYGLNSSVRRAIYERLDLFWPDRLQRWFPNSSRFRNQQQESELVALKIEDQH
ncbi:G-protein-coupled receptor 1 [Prunus dulcis]|uniref:G-protein-coupled receptor 1 n=1 Tax=Prunus dulcis TaxID=3755 RepID=A0A4Y1QTC1_PRUDU|nr:G-protein-coupled receptor 1 [Prunus dulcis]